MLQEYALEPSLLSRWSNFRFFVGHFGFERGRLISRYPRRWKKLVYESLTGCGEIERAKIEEALRRIDDRLVSRRTDTWNHASPDWLVNAEAEHASQPFWAIIAQSNPRSHLAVIIGDDVHDTLDWDSLPNGDSRRLWRANHSRIIERTAKEMAETVESLLNYGQRILFVDPHFGPENSRYLGPFREFMSQLGCRTAGKFPSTVEYHCAIKSEVSFFRKHCNLNLASMIPSGMKVTFRRWSSGDMHNRFVLTDRGGIAFMQGLDQFDGKGPDQDVVVLLDHVVSQQLIDDFSIGKTRFTVSDEGVFEVLGTCSVPRTSD